MGANVYLESVASYGYISTGTSVTALTQEIPGRTGKRIAIRAFEFLAGGTAEVVYFMQSLGKTTLAADVATTLSSLNLTGEPGPSGNSLATGDYVCVILDDGTYDFAKVGAITGLSIISLCGVITGSCALGQTVYDLGAYSDTGHIRYKMATTSGGNGEEMDGGIFYGTEKGSPMIVHELCKATGSEAQHFITVDYINK